MRERLRNERHILMPTPDAKTVPVPPLSQAPLEHEVALETLKVLRELRSSIQELPLQMAAGVVIPDPTPAPPGTVRPPADSVSTEVRRSMRAVAIETKAQTPLLKENVEETRKQTPILESVDQKVEGALVGSATERRVLLLLMILLSLIQLADRAIEHMNREPVRQPAPVWVLPAAPPAPEH